MIYIMIIIIILLIISILLYIRNKKLIVDKNIQTEVKDIDTTIKNDKVYRILKIFTIVTALIVGLTLLFSTIILIVTMFVLLISIITLFQIHSFAIPDINATFTVLIIGIMCIPIPVFSYFIRGIYFEIKKYKLILNSYN